MEHHPPPIPLNVVEYLERIFPDKAPGPHETIDLVRYKSGQASVHRHLRGVYEDQVKNFAKRMKENY